MIKTNKKSEPSIDSRLCNNFGNDIVPISINKFLSLYLYTPKSARPKFKYGSTYTS